MPRPVFHARKALAPVTLLALLGTAPGCSERSQPTASKGAPRSTPAATDKLTTSTHPAAASPSAAQARKLPPSSAGAPQISANGTGCPAGSWHAEASSDGKRFTVSFPAYAAELPTGRGVSVKDCQVALQLPSDGKRSYALASLSLEGEAQLSAGSDAKLLASHYQQGSPPGDDGAEKQLQGPTAGPFRLEDTIADARRAWSKCGVQRDLNVATRVRLKGASAGTAVRVEPGKLVLELAERPCE